MNIAVEDLQQICQTNLILGCVDSVRDSCFAWSISKFLSKILFQVVGH
jgi:hypothetical protein